MALSTFFLLVSHTSPPTMSSSSMKYAFSKLKMMSSSQTCKILGVTTQVQPHLHGHVFAIRIRQHKNTNAINVKRLWTFMQHCYEKEVLRNKYQSRVDWIRIIESLLLLNNTQQNLQKNQDSYLHSQSTCRVAPRTGGSPPA